MNSALITVTILGFGFGLILLFLGLYPNPDAVDRPPGPLARLVTKWRGTVPRRTLLVMVGGVIGGIVLYLVTGLLVALVIVPAAVVGLPVLLAKPPTGKRIERLEAIEAWTRSLSGLLGSGVGIEQAIIVSLSSAPDPIKSEVGNLVARLNARWAPADALYQFADEMNDSTADVVAAHLVLATKMRGSGLAAALQDLSQTVSSEVRHRREVESDQEKPRATARNVTLVTLVALFLLSLTGDFLADYRTPTGQLLITTYVVLYVCALLWMRKLSQGEPTPRLLVDTRRAAS